MKGQRLPSEGRVVGGCPCGWWAVSNCRYIREVALLCRTKATDRPALPYRADALTKPPDGPVR